MVDRVPPSPSARLLSPLARLFVVLLAVAGCTTPQMNLPSSLVEHRLDVQHRGLRFSFGEFVVEASPPQIKVRRSSWGIFDGEEVRAQHRFGFTLVSHGVVVDEVLCERKSVEANYVGAGALGRSEHELECMLSAPDGYPRGELRMSAHNSVHHLSGTMMRRSVSIDLAPTEHPEEATMETGDAFAPAGFFVLIGRTRVGAVQTKDREAVWIDPRAPPWLRRYVALSAAVLLIHSEIHYTGPKLIEPHL